MSTGGFARAFATVAAVLAVGCASLFERPASREEQQAWVAATQALEQGDAAGRKALLRFLREHPEGPLADDAEFALGRIAQRAGEPAEAERRYRAAALAGGSTSDRARVALATLALERGDGEAARQWLGRVRLSRLDDPELRNAYRALAESAENPPERVRWLMLLRQRVDDPAERAEVDARIDGLLADLSARDLLATARHAGDRPPAARIYLALAERALDAGELDDAERALEEASKRPLEPRYAPRLAGAMARLRSRSVEPSDVTELPTFRDAPLGALADLSRARGRIGVVLPLSGPYARFGETALQGVLLAAGVFADSAGQPQVSVAVRDTGGSAARAAAAVRELAADGDVVAIVGPLLSDACEAAAEEAEAAGIPLLAMSARETIASERRWVFRVRTRPVEETQLVAERAIALGARRFAILYRDDPYGRGLRGLFWDAVEAGGGEVVGIASYDPDSTDFAGPIRRLVGYTLLGPEERRVIAQRDRMLDRARRLSPSEARAMRARARSLTTSDGAPVPPIVDFDALFIPESHEKIVLIAPQLAFHEANGARLLGSVGWYDRDLMRLAGDHLEGALFPADFFPESPVPYVDDFRARFESHFGATPDAFAAQAYDAANLALLQLARGRDDRESVRDGILATEAFPGVAGVLTMRADGNANRRPFLLGIERGRIVQIVD